MCLDYSVVILLDWLCVNNIRNRNIVLPAFFLFRFFLCVDILKFLLQSEPFFCKSLSQSVLKIVSWIAGNWHMIDRAMCTQFTWARMSTHMHACVHAYGVCTHEHMHTHTHSTHTHTHTHNLIQCSRNTSRAGLRRMEKNEVEWTGKAEIRKGEFWAVGKACKALLDIIQAF